MADKPAAPKKPSENGHELAFKIAGVVILFFIVFSALENGSVLGPTIRNIENSNPVALSDPKNANVGDLLSEQKFRLGEEVVNRSKTIIRSNPGGEILGFQNGSAKGKIVEGPIALFNKNWWRVDYKKAPDGWVQGDDLSTSKIIFGVINFLPNLYSNIKNILILLGIILLVLVIIFSGKRRNAVALKKQKREVTKPAFYKKKEEPMIIIQDDTGLPIPNLPIANSTDALGLKFDVPENKRWKNIEYLVATHNSNDWRQAIIEADVILDEMLDRMGYEGNSIGEKLKKVEPSDFLTLNFAWEAHKVRNRIAHAGSGFVMSKDEAERVIDMYRKVFDEFYYI